MLGKWLTAAVTGFTQRAELAFMTAAEDWAGRLREDAGRRASAEAAQFRRYLSEPLRERDVDVIADLRSGLAHYEESLTMWVPEGDDLPDRHMTPQGARRRYSDTSCDICIQVQSALSEYLIRRQFLLATSEDDQVRHASAGGFCPLHTWQYARMASSVGISAGNSRLAGMIAETLGAIRASGGDAEQLSSAVRRLAKADGCPACAVLAKTEREAAAILVAELAPEREVPVLCLRHLPVALQAGPSPETGVSLVGALAQELERTAQDMRSYALKREALGRGLITADEASAPARALRLLAAQPALVLPWEQDPDGAAPAQ